MPPEIATKKNGNHKCNNKKCSQTKSLPALVYAFAYFLMSVEIVKIIYIASV